jgi:hypothetical protein
MAKLESFDQNKLKCSKCKEYFDLEQIHHCFLEGIWSPARLQYRCKKCCLLDDILVWLRTPASILKDKATTILNNATIYLDETSVNE